METSTLEPPQHTRATDPEPPGMAVRVLLATFLIGAGAIHLVMVPSHSQDSALDGALFALAGWAQIALGVFAVARPRRPVLQATVVANVAIIAAWAVSRTAGLPWGAHAGTAEDASSIDLLATGLAAGAVLLAGVALVRPGLGAKLSQEATVIASVVPVGLLVLTSMAMASPEVIDHHAGGDAEHAHGPEASLAAAAADRCDLSVNPAAYWRETEIVGYDTMTGGMMGDSADGHSHGTGAAAHPDPYEGRGSKELDDLIIATSNAGDGEVGAAMVVTKLSEAPDEAYEAWLHQLTSLVGGHSHGSASGDDTGGHGGHMGPTPWTGMTDQAQCDTLLAELDQARDVAMSYPTAADAVEGGWRMVTPYVPGIAAHYMKFDYVDGVFDIAEPEMLLYDGNSPDAKMVGLSYYIIHNAEAEPSQGFTGPNDHFHRHIGLCMKAGLVIGDSTTTEEECAAQGGSKGDSRGGWMNHVWIVPGCESPWGMFSGANPLLDKELGVASDEGRSELGCVGSGVSDRYDLTPGTAENTPTTVSGVVTEQAAP